MAHREGGAIRAESPASLIARNTVFLKNLVTSDDFDGLGGAIFVSEGTPQLEFHGCDFQRNNASTNGGALYYDAGGSMMFNGTSFVGNWARESGGGIFAKGAVGQVRFCTLYIGLRIFLYRMEFIVLWCFVGLEEGSS